MTTGGTESIIMSILAHKKWLFLIQIDFNISIPNHNQLKKKRI